MLAGRRHAAATASRALRRAAPFSTVPAKQEGDKLWIFGPHAPRARPPRLRRA